MVCNSYVFVKIHGLRLNATTLLLVLYVQHLKRCDDRLLCRATTGTRLRLTEGSITEVRPHLSHVAGVDMVDSTAFKLVRLSVGSGKT